ncbi:MAG: ATP-binding protein [Gemmataceae bacterium]
MKQLAVKLGNDQIERLSKANAIQAIEELVWNGYDADAKTITITVQLDAAGLGVAGLRVADDGTGIPFGQLDKTFEMIGDSVKRAMRKTPGGRIPRGRHGRGRFKAFALARTVNWVSRYEDGPTVREFTLHGDKSTPQPFRTTDPKPAAAGARTGVEVVIGPIDRPFPALLDTPHVVTELSKRLALGLVQHAVDIRYDGRPVNPHEFIANRVTLTFKVADGDGQSHEVALTVIEWNGLQARSVYLCDAEEVAQHEWEKFDVPAARTFSFTAYAQSVYVDRLVSSGTADLGDLSDDVRNLKAAVRQALDGHFRTRLAARAGGLVAGWRQDGIYPYPEADPNPVERVSREVFDVCAQAVHDLLPSFQQGPKANRRLLFRLLKQAVETDSGALCDILDQVLALTPEQQADLAVVLKTTRLGAVISAAKTVLDRLRFLESTHHLFFGQHAGDVNEPHQLQQILLQELWLFGDDYAYGRQEAYLRDALEVHAKHTGRAFDPNTGAITNVRDGKKSRLDLLLNSTYARTPPYDYEHLVVELKRSSVTLGGDELNQIESYAQTVEDDARFDKQKTRWTWYLVGVECDKYAEGRRTAADRPHGLIANRGGVQVWVKTWAEIVSAAKRRYEFFLEKLEAELTADDGLCYLRERHGKHLPDALGTAAGPTIPNESMFASPNDEMKPTKKKAAKGSS